MNLKLVNIFNDMLGKSAQGIITAILDGENNPDVLVGMADRHCMKSKYEPDAALSLTSEFGLDFVEKFLDARHFVSWVNLVPNNKISGGKLLSSCVPHKKNSVGLVLRQCANALNRFDNPMGSYFRHIKSKSGYLPAMVATGKKLGTILYTMVKNR